MYIIDSYNALVDYPDVLSIQQIQEILNIGRNSIYNLLQANKIKSIKIGKKYVVPKQSIINFLKIA